MRNEHAIVRARLMQLKVKPATHLPPAHLGEQADADGAADRPQRLLWEELQRVVAMSVMGILRCRRQQSGFSTGCEGVIC
jgi:hypothetical protein